MGQTNGTPNTKVGGWEADLTGKWTAEQADAKFQKDKNTIKRVAKQLQAEVQLMQDQTELQNSIQRELKTLLDNINSTDQSTVKNIQDKWDTLSLRTEKGAKDFLNAWLQQNKQTDLTKKATISKFRSSTRMAVQTLLRKKGYFTQADDQKYFQGKNKGHATEENGKARIDGIYGDITTGAIRKFQEDYNKQVEDYNKQQTDSNKRKTKLVVDGKIGPKTIEALLENFSGTPDVVNNDGNTSDKKAKNPNGSSETDTPTGQLEAKAQAQIELNQINKMSFDDFKNKYGENPDALEDLCKKAGYTSLNEYLRSDQSLKNRIEALQELSEIDDKASLSVVKTDYSKDNIQKRCQNAHIEYDDWIKNYSQLKTNFDILDIIKDSTTERGEINNSNLEKSIDPIKLGSIDYSGFKDADNYGYSQINTLRQNTLPKGIDGKYQTGGFTENNDDDTWKQFNEIHQPRIKWLKSYESTWSNRINNIPNDLKQYIKDINTAFDKNLYDDNGKIKNEHKDKVYIDNKDFVKAFIRKDSSNNDLTNIKRITAKIGASANNKTMISGKEYKITLKGTTFTKSKLNPEQLNIVNGVLQSNHSQRTEIFAELCTEDQTLNTEKILWGGTGINE